MDPFAEPFEACRTVLLLRRVLSNGQVAGPNSATLVEHDAARASQPKIGSPLFSRTRAMNDASGDEYLHALSRPGRYSFHVDRARNSTAGKRRWHPVWPKLANVRDKTRPRANSGLESKSPRPGRK